MPLSVTSQDVEEKHRQIEENLQGWLTPTKRVKEFAKYHDLRIAKNDIYENIESWVVTKKLPYSHFLSEREEKVYNPLITSEIRIEVGDEEMTIPLHLFFLLKVINKSRYILELEEGWDGEEGTRYNQLTWKNAIKFVINYSKCVYEKTSTIIDAPDIYHADKGSIDILWKNESYRLLINIPDNGVIASFYGDNYKEDKVKGTFDINNSNQGLLLAITSI